ncbi:restriction endonuclease subunit S [Hymenobacter lapidiphilus]|uniref:restriction endonuclease subunit S n=1 Tax=Hymenobacter sp. CCM 8763 TaxID=2303334 RepID=UPI00167D6188|nr:restriction endonuclease subunit S [Hymenobacter sp. CCM 8763]
MQKLSAVTNNLDNRRKPLNSTQREVITQKGLYPYIGANNIMGLVDEYLFDEEILCVAEDGGSWGKGEKCAVIYNEKCWVNNHAHVLTAKSGTHLKYLMYYLNQEDLTQYVTGSTRGKLTKGALDSIPIPLPPLAEQIQIAQVLDQADRLRQQDRQLLAHYDQLVQAVFVDMFGDPVRNEKGWPMGTIRDIITEAKYGTSKPAEDAGTYPYLRMNNLTYEGSMDFKSLKYINLDEKEEPKYLVHKGDLLFNRTNSKELVGKTAVYRMEKEMAIAGYLIRVRSNERSNTEYISAFLNSKYGKLTLLNMCKSIVGMANINAQELQNISIPIPPVDLQNQFAEIVAQIEVQKATTQQLQLQSEALFNSLLQQAFRGELGQPKPAGKVVAGQLHLAL